MAVKRRSRGSAFVPKLLVRTAIAGVVPACALACGSSDPGPVGDAGQDAPILGVAAVAYPAYDASPVDASAPSDAAKEAAPINQYPDVEIIYLAVTAYEVGPAKKSG
jgi:hypothetical protein